jgi:hypothetical protein
MAMTGVVIAALIFRPSVRLYHRPFRRLGWAGLLLLLIYASNTYFLYIQRN